MTILEVLLFCAGFALVGWTLLSAIRTVILPRSAQVAITRWVFRALRVPFWILAHERRTYAARDRVMALYAPVALVALPGVWLVLVLTGYMGMFFAIGDFSLAEAFHLSGSSLTTLGFANAKTFAEDVLSFSEAGFGLFLAALMVTYLPSMYGAFSRREAEVALLEVRAGNPPSAAEFLERHHRIGWLDDLGPTWLAWERWFAELEESHTSYPALTFFRSPQPERSWVVAAGTVLDSAALYVSCTPVVEIGPPGVCLRAGFLALRRIALFFGIEFDPDPAPTDPISITRHEFDQVWERLAAEGVPLKPDREQAWRDFAGWRVNYDTVLLALAEIVMAPVAPWTSDRSGPGLREPQVRRFGRRLHGSNRADGASDE
jgi:hypothetical protein